MTEPLRITKSEVSLADTFNLNRILGHKVISKKGQVVGRVREVRIRPDKKSFEGIVTSCPRLGKSIYIGFSYIETITANSILLTMDPTVLLKGFLVIDSQGQKVGKISQVNRADNTNEVESFIVSSFLRKPFQVTLSQTSKIGDSIILKPSYNVPRKYIWQRS